MKRAKRIYILLGILAAVCILTFAVVKHEEKQENIRNSGEVVLEVPTDSVSSLSWECGAETLSFHKEEQWLYDEDEAFPVDEEKISQLLDLFRQLHAAFIIEDVTDYSQYGLDDPVCRILLSAGEENYEITLGDYSTMDSQRYLSLGDGNVYLVADDPLEYFDISLRDLIDNDEVPDLDQAESILFTGKESYQVVYEEYTDDSPYTYCSQDVYFKEEGDALLPLDTTRVDSYLSSLSGLTLTGYMTYNASEEDLAQYGLDDPELTVTVRYLPSEESETASFTIHISRDPKELSSDENAQEADEEEEEITAYARVEDSKIIYEISSADYKALMACHYDDLRHSEIFTADFSDVTGIEVSLDGNHYSMTSEGSGNDKNFFYEEEEIDIGDLKGALEGIIASDFTDETPSGKEEVSLSLSLDNKVHPKIEITLYRYDGEQCLATVDGDPVCLVSRSSVVELIEAINAVVL